MADHPVQFAARIKTLHWTLADASGRAYEQFLEIRDEIAQLDHNPDDPDEDPSEFVKFGEAQVIAGIQAIVMSVMCFESAIYDYGATQLGDRYVRQHLDRLDPVAKWVVIPRLVCGKEVSKDRLPFSTFRHVVSERNRLVHWKSTELRLGDATQMENLQSGNERFEENVHRSFRALVLMSFEMDRLLGAQFNPLPSFDREKVFPWRYSPRINDVISECRRRLEEAPA